MTATAAPAEARALSLASEFEEEPEGGRGVAAAAVSSPAMGGPSSAEDSRRAAGDANAVDAEAAS